VTHSDNPLSAAFFTAFVLGLFMNGGLFWDLFRHSFPKDKLKRFLKTAFATFAAGFSNVRDC